MKLGIVIGIPRLRMRFADGRSCDLVPAWFLIRACYLFSKLHAN